MKKKSRDYRKTRRKILKSQNVERRQFYKTMLKTAFITSMNGRNKLSAEQLANYAQGNQNSDEYKSLLGLKQKHHDTKNPI